MRKVISIGLLAAVTLGACRDTTGPDRLKGARYTIALNPTAPVAGDAVTVTAQLVDAAGASVRLNGRRVKWTSASGGTFTTPVSPTGPDGIATTVATVPTKAGIDYQIGVTDDGGLAGTSHVTVQPAAPSKYVVLASMSAAVAGSTISISAQLADRFSNAVAASGRVVTWSVQRDSSASFSAPTSTTDTSGVATVSFTLGLTANRQYVIQAADPQVTGSSLAIQAIAGPGVRYGVLIDPSQVDPPAGAPVTVLAWLADANGNVVNAGGRTITWAATGAGGTFASPTSTLPVVGETNVVFTPSTTAGVSYAISATDDAGVTGTGATFTTQPQIALSSIATGAGPYTTCGLSPAGSMWCWGANEHGQIGNGTTTTRFLPTRTGGNLNFASASVGPTFACGVSSGGTVYCWGDNAYGQLGDGSFTARAAPAPIASTAVFQSVTVGAGHACAVAANADAYCWGDNTLGQAGLVTQHGGATSLPTKVAGGLSFVALSAGDGHTCGVATTGSTYCWGDNSRGQIGIGSLSAVESTPRVVAGDPRFMTVAAGGSHACGIMNDGSAYCWGDNSYGQLGVGPGVAFRAQPTQVNGTPFSAISVGGVHTCAITAAGAASCWGDNSAGQLGTGKEFGAYLPTPVAGGLQFKSISVASSITRDYYGYLSLADARSCGITTGGVVYCWGSNTNGQLGVGMQAASGSTPLKVAGQR